MPTYSYECPACSHRQDVFKPMHQCKDPETCSGCGVQTERAYDKPPITLNKAYRKPIEMFSVAPETPGELVALQTALPDTKFTDQGVPIAHSRSEKKAILRATRYEEH